MYTKLLSKNNYLSFSGFQRINNEIILSNVRGNGLFIIDSDNYQIKEIKKFISMPEEAQRYHRGCCAKDNSVYFYPDGVGNGIHKYDVLKKEQVYIETGDYTCSYAYINEEEMILLPAYATDKILKLDLRTDTLNKIEVHGLERDKIGSNFFKCGQISGNKVWMSLVRTPSLFIVDLVSKEVCRQLVGNEDIRLWGTAYDGINYWFTLLDDERIIKYNPNEKISRYYNVHRDPMIKQYTIIYKEIIAYENKVILVDWSGIFLLDTVNEKLECLALFPKNMKAASVDWHVEYQFCGTKLVMCLSLTNIVAVMDMNSLEVVFFSTIVENSEEFDKYTQGLCRRKLNAILNEEAIAEGGNSDLAELQDFIKLVQLFDREMKGTENHESVGESIYESA